MSKPAKWLVWLLGSLIALIAFCKLTESWNPPTTPAICIASHVEHNRYYLGAGLLGNRSDDELYSIGPTEFVETVCDKWR